MKGFSPRLAYASAGTAAIVGIAALGMSGHGLPALGMQLRTGQAWLANVANHSVSFIDGYSGEVVSQVGVDGGTSQVVNTPHGAVVVGTNGHLVSVSNDNFTTTSSVELLGGGSLTAAAGGSALYAVNTATGQIQRLDSAEPQLPPVGAPVSVGSPVVSPVVAPDGSLYVGIPKTGSVGHVTKSHLSVIKDVAKPGSDMAVVLAGTKPVAADLTHGVLRPLGATAVAGPGLRLPASALPIREVTGSDSANGLVGTVGKQSVDSANVMTGAVSATPLPSGYAPTSAAMLGSNMVLADSARRDVLFVNTRHHTTRTFSMPGKQPPSQVTVQDGLAFVNAPDGPNALVINGNGNQRQVTKYTAPPPPPHHKHATIPSPSPSAHPSHRPSAPPKPPGAPAHPAALGGNAKASVSWGAAPGNGSPITRYLLSWTGANGSSGRQTVPGSTLTVTVTGLANGTAYTFTVRAQNKVGTGPAATTAPVTPSSTVPATPTAVKATVPTDNGSVSLSWTEPNNGDQVSSYTVTNVATGVTTAKVTGTSVTIPGVVTATTATFGPATFTVTAVDASGHASQPSAASNQVTPFLAPGTPAVDTNNIQYAANGTSVTLSVSCDATCQRGGPVRSYTVSVGNGVAPVTQSAPSDGSATTVTVSGLNANTSYTAQVTATDTAGFGTAAGGALAVPLVTLGPPTITAVSVTQPTIAAGAGAAVDVAVTVNPGGESGSCTYSISVSGGSSRTGIACGSTAPVSIGVPSYNTAYSVTVTAANAAGGAPAFPARTGTSSLKALDADASTAFGATCPNVYGGTANCGPDSGTCSSASLASCSNNVTGGTTVYATCWEAGQGISGVVPPTYASGKNYYNWVHVTGPVSGFMSELWFISPPAVTAGLPHC